MITLNKNIGNKKLTGLLGHPVAHSKSPLMHNTAFELLGLDYTYELFDVDENEMEDAFSKLKELDIKGFNCTMPDKIKAYELADEHSQAAKLIGACNTVVVEDGKFIGHNTDGIGFVSALKNKGFDIKDKKMTILGCGGAALAIIVQCALDSAKEIDVLCIKDKFYDNALSFTKKVSEETNCPINLIEMNDENIKESIATSQLLANATPVGMAPNTDGCLISDSSYLREDLFVMDIIYNPLETKLVKMAKEKGCNALNGIDMLYYQADAAFKLWTGKAFPDEVKEKLYDSIING